MRRHMHSARRALHPPPSVAPGLVRESIVLVASRRCKEACSDREIASTIHARQIHWTFDIEALPN